MTDLARRPTGSAAADGAVSGGRRAAAQRSVGRAWRRLRGTEERTLAGAAVLAAAGAVAAGLAVSMVVALVGWYLAEGGAYGETTSALAVAVQVWLLAHGAQLSIGGVPFGLLPLTLTIGQGWLVWRLARRAGRTAGGGTRVDLRALAQAATVLVGVYLVLVTAICVVSGGGAVSASIPRAVVGSLLLALVAGPVGLAQGCDRLGAVLDLLPGWVRAVLHGAGVAVAVLLAGGALLLVVAVGFGFNDALAVLAGLRLDGTDQAAYGAATLLVVPNAVVMAAAYLLGPGFAVGAGSVVSPSAVVLGPVPAFPLLAALPAPGTPSPWLMAVLVVPVLAALVGAGRAQAAYAVSARDSAALRGFGAGAVAGLAMTGLAWLAGGPVGTGRLAQVGPPVLEVAVLAIGSMALAGLVGGLVVALWQRRGRGSDPAEEPQPRMPRS